MKHEPVQHTTAEILELIKDSPEGKKPREILELAKTHAWMSERTFWNLWKKAKQNLEVIEDNGLWRISEHAKHALENPQPVTQYWKVRICIKGCAILHFLTKAEPIVTMGVSGIQSVAMDCVTGTEAGDTIGFIDWTQVASITWRPVGLEEN